MKLKKVKVENYKCIENSEEFLIDDITCLVGKNEAGKSAILQALYKLNPIEEDFASFIETEYPRRFLSTYRERTESGHANVLTTEWTLDDTDLAYVKEELGADPFLSPDITVSKGYSNIRCWTVQLTEVPVVQRFVQDAELESVERASLEKCDSFTELSATLSSKEELTSGAQQLLQQVEKNFPNGFSKQVYALLASLLPTFLYFREYDK